MLHRIFSGKHCIEYRTNKIVIYKKDGSVSENPKFIENVNICFLGENNILELFEPVVFENNCIIKFCGWNSKVLLNKCRVKESVFLLGHASNLSIDENSVINAHINMINEESLKVRIGKDCMFSFGIEIWATDGHSIFDTRTKKCLNTSKSAIEIADHVWIGFKTTILKDAKIPSNSIVASNSIVTKAFETPNIMIAGCPAKKIKENVNWNKNPPDKLEI